MVFSRKVLNSSSARGGGDEAFKKSHAAAQTFCPVFAFLRLFFLHKRSAPVFKLSGLSKGQLSFHEKTIKI